MTKKHTHTIIQRQLPAGYGVLNTTFIVPLKGWCKFENKTKIELFISSSHQPHVYFRVYQNK